MIKQIKFSIRLETVCVLKISYICNGANFSVVVYLTENLLFVLTLHFATIPNFKDDNHRFIYLKKKATNFPRLNK